MPYYKIFGVIKLDPKVDTINATVKNIKENPKNLKFKKIAPELTAKAYENSEGDAVFINVNYAIQNKLNPKKIQSNLSKRKITRMQTSSLFAKVTKNQRRSRY